MPRIEFTSHLSRHIECPAETVVASTLREALNAVFEENPPLRGYILDDQGAIRKHVAIFIDGQMLGDRENLDISVSAESEIFVMQALSGG